MSEKSPQALLIPSEQPGCGRQRHLHVTREALARFDLPPAAFGLFGQVMGLSHAAAARWAARVRGATATGGAGTFSAGELLAAVALHELMHALIAVETGEGEAHAGAVSRALEFAEVSVGATALRGLMATFAELYAPASQGAAVSAEPTERAEGEVFIEELLLLDLARSNKALTPLRALFLAPDLYDSPTYAPVVGAIDNEAGGGLGLLELLSVPQLEEPDSLARQLQLALRLWGPRLQQRYARALVTAATALNVLSEEARPAWGPPGPTEARLPQQTALVDDGEPEAYSEDAAWMPGVVLVAKSTYVWLAQLSRRFGRQVKTLDDVPEEALAELAAQGFNALWLIGVWWRSEASRTIKRLRGQPDAMASAYSVREYVVAPDLGGEAALARLSERAARYGVRLASDMVPNHTAIDGAWMLEHPDWYVQASEPPYPNYRFSGPDLSSDARMTIRLEDHYYDGSDAAVVFQRVDNPSGDVRYVYHGNDGTALPWNDTAQLDFLKAEVRRAVIDTTVAVARRFPLIRLDAAMTLARRHFRRLWHPQPGEGGAIPSRAGVALTQREFDELMPTEFWRELVDELAVKAPGTMLLAEAFWLMEVYFVRSLGMNRVYNSAFMHMTMNEQNAEYRAYLKRYLEEAPPVLARFVNYMSNPDEETAADQYGDGDKAFGVATLLATLPGLPMFGHGQVEGLREKYGMEFSRPRTDEEPRPWHVERHMRQIAPLLELRDSFAGSELFRLYDLVTDGGEVAEDVYAYVNGVGAGRTLVVYNNAPRPVSGRIHVSAPAKTSDGAAVSEALHAALGLRAAPGAEAVLTTVAGEELRVGVQVLATAGLRIELGAYEARVYVSVRVEPAAEDVGGYTRRTSRRGATNLNIAVLTGKRGVAARRRSARRRR